MQHSSEKSIIIIIFSHLEMWIRLLPDCYVII